MAGQPPSRLQVCLVTGGSRGIGAAVVRTLATPERLVFLNYSKSEAQARAVCECVQQSGGGRVEMVQADVSDRGAVSRMMETVAQDAGTLDILVHNASLPLVPKRILKLDWQCDVLPHLGVACAGFLNCMQAAKPLFRNGSRVVVLLTDALFHQPPVQMGAYLAAKGALWGMVRAAAKELLPLGVFVNAVSPGMTKTDLLQNYPDRALEIISHDHPLGRLARPGEVAAAVEFLATDKGAYMHGANLIVNGGAAF
jgi:3-oxoacyl-[acyl-carrier protein] reductase